MRILVAEYSPELAAQLRAAMVAAHFAVDIASDGEKALFLGKTEPYDAVVLDLGLPRLDGLSVLRRWRSVGRAMQVLILTARDSWTEKVAGLDAGADDYLAKPLAMAELLARLRALVRRAHGRAQAEIQLGELLIDPAAGSAALRGMPVWVTGWNSSVDLPGASARADRLQDRAGRASLCPGFRPRLQHAGGRHRATAAQAEGDPDLDPARLGLPADRALNAVPLAHPAAGGARPLGWRSG